jgi:hypothetical protein
MKCGLAFASSVGVDSSSALEICKSAEAAGRARHDSKRTAARCFQG